jgi:mRNA interferase HicA
MTGKELLGRITRLGRARGIVVRFDRRHGKGSHGTLHYGSHKTTLKDLRKEIGPGLLGDVLAQLGLTRRDLDEGGHRHGTDRLQLPRDTGAG